MTNYARAERTALCDTLVGTGPDAPTLCEGWRTRDLAAHLVVRERRPDAQAGIYLPPLAARTRSVQSATADQPWTSLVAAVRSGPPRWNPTRVPVVDEAVNTAEFFVHHEDVRRAQPGWQPRDLDDDQQRALWRLCSTTGRLAARHAEVGIELVAPGHGRVRVKRGDPMVRVEGAPAELVLYLFGRRQVAQVRLDGPQDAIDRLAGAPMGL
jgi:uncharacterized protein (TIGR03085 family)